MAAVADADGGMADIPGKCSTLTDNNPEYAARHAAYQERKNQRASKKKQGDKKESINFLSNLNEVDGDVAYRFSFTIVGTVAKEVVDAVCNSDAAIRLGGGASNAPKNVGHRCLCHVTEPKGVAAGQTRLAKIALESKSFDEDVPTYETRQEALSAAIIYVLTIDTPVRGDSDFKSQLDNFDKALQRMRAASRARLRPVKVVLLACVNSEDTAPKSSLEQWAVQLADFEQLNGDMWKFGPISLRQRDSMHSTIAEMTSARIVHTQNKNDEAQKPGEDVVDPKERDELTGTSNLTPLAGRRGSGASAASQDAESTCSEQERPPHFEAEMSGSECSETAREFHTRVFGAVDEEELAPLVGAPISVDDTDAPTESAPAAEVPVVVRHPIASSRDPEEEAKTPPKVEAGWEMEAKSPNDPLSTSRQPTVTNKSAGACCVFC